MTAGQNQLKERKKDRSRSDADQRAPKLLLPFFLSRPFSSARTGLLYVILPWIVPLRDFRLLRLVEPPGVSIILCNHLYLRT